MTGFPTVRESALIIEIPEAEPVVAQWRRDHDPIASHGIPPHITVLYPFVEPDAMTEADAVRIREVLREVTPWTFELTAIREFPGVVWLQPDPAAPFRSLTRRLWRAFPDFPPFAGRYPDLVPHMTMARVLDGEDQATLVSRVASDVAASLPIVSQANALSLYVSAHDRAAWQCTHRFRFSAPTTAP